MFIIVVQGEGQLRGRDHRNIDWFITLLSFYRPYHSNDMSALFHPTLLDMYLSVWCSEVILLHVIMKGGLM